MHNFNFFAEKPDSIYRKSDSLFIVLIMLLWGIGMVTLQFCSANYGQRFFGNSFHFVQRQLISSLVGFILLIFFAVADVEKLRKILPVIVLGSIVLSLLTFIPGIGVERNGARRWIKIPYFSTFQPSEALKFSMVLFLANLFDKQSKLPEEDRSVVPALVGLLVFSVIILCQQDLGTALFVMILGLSIFFVTGAKLLWFVPMAFLLIPFGLIFILTEPYRVNRIIGFIAQDSFAQSLNWQINGSKRAITDGGLFGQGIGSGLTKLGGVPEIQSDYVFAGWAEAMGFFGVLIYLCILGLFLWRVYRICMTCGNRFASIASFGFGAVIVAQSLLNIAVVAGVVPTTGIPLPFFSSGGSSMMVTLAMCGFIINSSRIEQTDESVFFTGE